MVYSQCISYIVLPTIVKLLLIVSYKFIINLLVPEFIISPLFVQVDISIKFGEQVPGTGRSSKQSSTSSWHAVTAASSLQDHLHPFANLYLLSQGLPDLPLKGKFFDLHGHIQFPCTQRAIPLVLRAPLEGRGAQNRRNGLGGERGRGRATV